MDSLELAGKLVEQPVLFFRCEAILDAIAHNDQVLQRRDVDELSFVALRREIGDIFITHLLD